MAKPKQSILSGIRPTGPLHIGNYLGALKNFVALQENYECFFMLADLHALDTTATPDERRDHTLGLTAEYMAVGLDPKVSTIFAQSHIPAHAELSWLFGSLVPISELERMTQYKDKSKKHRENINAVLLDYPVLMAADILLYKTDVVPVGQDQTQHLELTRTLAKKFNSLYGQTFSEPKTMLVKEGAKIMSLLEPKKKMSKSDNPDSYIAITDDAETIKRKIAKAVTDTGKDVKFDPAKKPGISNLLTIHSLFSNQKIPALEKRYKGKGYAPFKKALATLLVEKLEPFHRKYEELKRREVYVKTILSQGKERARTIAASNLEEIKEKVGLLPE